MGIRIVSSLVTGDDVICYGNEVQLELILNRALVQNHFGSYLIPYLTRIKKINNGTRCRDNRSAKSIETRLG